MKERKTTTYLCAHHGKRKALDTETRPCRTPRALLEEGCKRALAQGSDASKTRAGGGASVGSVREGRGVDLREESGARERARRRGAWGGGKDSGGAARAGRAVPPEAEGAEPRSQLPPGRRAQADDTARGRARTARTHSPNNAPRRPAGRLAARRRAARPGERGPEVSPRRLLQSLPLFVWQTWPQREAPGERGGYRAGDPSRRPPG